MANRRSVSSGVRTGQLFALAHLSSVHHIHRIRHAIGSSSGAHAVPFAAGVTGGTRARLRLCGHVPEAPTDRGTAQVEICQGTGHWSSFITPECVLPLQQTGIRDATTTAET